MSASVPSPAVPRRHRGPFTLFPGKLPRPSITFTAIPAHHTKLRVNMLRLGLTRSDLLGLLIERHADTVVS